MEILIEIYCKALELSRNLKQIVGEKHDYYITMEQLERIMKKYESKNDLSSQIDEDNKRFLGDIDNLYEKLQDTKYYKELSYIEKQVYLSAIEDVGQAIELRAELRDKVNKNDK